MSNKHICHDALPNETRHIISHANLNSFFKQTIQNNLRKSRQFLNSFAKTCCSHVDFLTWHINFVIHSSNYYELSTEYKVLVWKISFSKSTLWRRKEWVNEIQYSSKEKYVIHWHVMNGYRKFIRIQDSKRAEAGIVAHNHAVF